VAAVFVVFAVVAAYVVYTNQGGGGKNVRFDITVAHADTMKPSELDVHQNDLVTISINSDTDGEVHLHDYDHAFDCKAGQVTAYSFKADKSGTFEIEWESTSRHLGDLVVAP
jgi:hypothetical protein